MKPDAVTMSLLYDYYGQLLTEKQASCFDLYHNQDFSLGEIAQELGISRQGVHDSLARSESALLKFEENIGYLERSLQNQKLLDAVKQMVEALPQAEEILPILNQIQL